MAKPHVNFGQTAIEFGMAQRGAYAKTSVTDRQRLIAAFNRDEDWVVLARQLGIKRQTAQSIISTFNDTGRIATLPRGGNRESMLQGNTLDDLLNWVSEHPTATLGQMRDYLETMYPDMAIPHSTTISRCLDGQLITLKLLRTNVFEWNTDVTKAARYEYVSWMLNEGVQQNLIFMDEFGVNLWTARTQGRAVRGERAVRIANGQRGRNLTICLAISPQWGLVHATTVVGGFRNTNFHDFVSELEEIVDEPFTLVLDGARAHGNIPGMQQGHTCQFLPPYSPFLNPTERAGSCLKAAMKRVLPLPEYQTEIANTEGAAAAGLTLHAWRLAILRKVVTDCLPEITLQKCVRWNNCTASYYQRCLIYEDINE